MPTNNSGKQGTAKMATNNSDHYPIWLECNNRNWGPKPFKFNNCWLEHPDFIPFVKASWESMDIHGRKVFILKEKLKRLKESLRKWNHEVFGIMDLNIEKTVKELNEIEEMIANGNSHPMYLNSKKQSKMFWEQLQFKESILKQKSRTKWIQEGDSNTSFFHATIKGCRRKPFGEEGVRETVWSCDGNKCPGPDGFNINFFKACWSIVKDDVMAFISEFHHNAHLPKALTASFLTLVPKKDHPHDLFDYRPLCLIGSIYKIVSKLLANRLKKVLGKLISNCQSAFLPQRQILDGVVVLNEIIDLAKRRKDACLLFKVDFERTYDTVSSSFLELMMIKMGFSEGWLKWLRACIFESTMSILINGSPTADFKVERGLRQGDPLSPFLFLIVAEGLTGLMNRAVAIDKFKGYQIGNNIQFPILQFADDTILMGDGTWDNIHTIKIVLRGFELISGLKINFVKSKLYGINVDTRLLEAGSTFLSCRADTIPFKFLGIPVGANPRRREMWKPVVDADILGMGRGTADGCFKSIVRPCVGNGVDIGFWKFTWYGNQSFSELYPDLYVKEMRQNASIADRLGDFGESSVISWQWTEQLSDSEQQQAAELTDLLIGFSLQPGYLLR
ncbi:hypothetical protein TSUD_217420 [Trifolium subterraneum]|uniref:Reverse transcriptase domain-containing protein n=1 Tax=Trifolium subterraneum TaxID=3900 RepID=A0A2Z6NCN0_TRISU|nr:hypothetical protein TSUD_217420 [Trifolium subterraneum]